MRILAVDDDDLTLSILPIVLADAGYNDVTLYNSSEAALACIESGKRVYDCLFFDIVMPFMHGIELCRRVRALPGYKKTPIIMLTAFSDASDVNEAYEAGATDFITKPFDLTEIGACVRKMEIMFPRNTNPQNIEKAKAAPPNIFQIRCKHA